MRRYLTVLSLSKHWIRAQINEDVYQREGTDNKTQSGNV